MLFSIQILRALAAWAVVGHHVVHIYPGMRTMNDVATAFTIYGAFGVDLFFVISGFVIYTSTVDKDIKPSRFLIARLARVVPAYWLFTLLTAAVLLINDSFVKYTVLDARLFVKSMLFIPAENRSGYGILPVLTLGWTLNIEMAFYAIFAIALGFPRAVRLTIVAAGVAILNAYVPKLGGSTKLYSDPIVFEFLFGIAIGIIYRRGWLSNIRPWLSCALAASCVAFIVAYAERHGLMAVGAPCALIVLAAVALEPLLARFQRLAALGDWSYATYLSHVLIVTAAASIGADLDLSPFVTIPASLLVVAFVSWVCYTRFEVPVGQAIRKWLHAGRSAALSDHISSAMEHHGAAPINRA
jgi:peptidoglycan/LPS O-acetylase OafA/YrhL